MRHFSYLLIASVFLAAGCSKKSDNQGAGKDGGEVASFSLAWSEYPSWSVFGVAHAKGILNGKEGELGEVEKKWGVDVVLKQVDYDTCISMYSNGTVDAVCITNMDALAPALGRKSTAILPTSTSVGADACIVVGLESIDDLKGKTTYGLEKSVSQYCFERNLELLGKDRADYPFENMDPGAAATAMQSGQEKVQSIIVWNPFVMQTLRTRKEAKRLFDSSTIPEEIIDMVVVSRDSLGKKGGDKFAAAVIEAFYRVSDLIEDSEQRDNTLVALGAKFSNLGAEDMKQVVKETQFYKNPQAALKLFEGDEFQKDTMPRVVDFCVSQGIVEKNPTVGFGDDEAQLNFDVSYIKQAQDKK